MHGNPHLFMIRSAESFFEFEQADPGLWRLGKSPFITSPNHFLPKNFVTEFEDSKGEKSSWKMHQPRVL
jgi:hypothetical protein